MPQYIFVYLGGEMPSSPEEGKAHFEKYQRWLMSLGDAVVSPAVPFKDTHTVRSDGSAAAGTTTAMSGLSVTRAGASLRLWRPRNFVRFLELMGYLTYPRCLKLAIRQLNRPMENQTSSTRPVAPARQART